MSDSYAELVGADTTESRPGRYHRLFDKSSSILFLLPLLFAPFSVSISDASLVLFFLAYIASGRWRHWRSAVAQSWFWPITAIIALNVLGMLWTTDVHRGVTIIHKTAYLLLIVTGGTLPWNRRTGVLAVRLFLAGLVLNASIGLLQWFGLFPWRPMAPSLGPIGYAGHIFLSMALCQALLWLAYDIKHAAVLPRSWNIVLAVVFFAQLAVTGGRAGQVAFVILFPLALWILYSGRWRAWVLAVAVCAIAGLAASPLVRHRFEVGIQNLQQYQAGTTVTNLGLRLVMWEGALKMAFAHPIIGVGTGDYALEMHRMQQSGALPATPGVLRFDHPHNSYLACLADLGVPGLAILLWLLRTLVLDAWKGRFGVTGWFKLAFLSVFLLGSLTDTLLWANDSLVFFCVISAIPATFTDELLRPQAS